MNINDEHNVSLEELATWGMQSLAYVRPVLEGKNECFALFAADGTTLGITENWAEAIAALLEHDLEPQSVH